MYQCNLYIGKDKFVPVHVIKINGWAQITFILLMWYLLQRHTHHVWCSRYFVTDHITAVIDRYIFPPWRCCRYISSCSSTINIMQVIALARSLDVGSSNLYDVKKHKKFRSSVLVVKARKVSLILRFWRKEKVVIWIRMLFNGPHFIGLVMFLFRAKWLWHRHEFSLKTEL